MLLGYVGHFDVVLLAGLPAEVFFVCSEVRYVVVRAVSFVIAFAICVEIGENAEVFQGVLVKACWREGGGMLL